MTRSVPEWIGKTDDAKVPPRVKLRIFERHAGCCYWSNIKIRPGMDWQLDHIIALVNGGEHRESNLAPILYGAHKKKTALDMREKARSARIRKRHAGIKRPSRMPGARNSPWKKKITGEVVRR